MNCSHSITKFSDDVSTCLRWSGLDFVNFTVSHTHNSMSESFQTDIVSYHNHSNLFLHVQVNENFHDDISTASVKISSRFIEKQNLGLVRNGTGNSNTLLLTTRQLVWEMVHSLLEANILQELACSLANLLATEFTLQLHWKLHILKGSERTDQVEGLENEA